MVDTRFHHCAGPMQLGELLSAAGHAALVPTGEAERPIAGAGDLAAARPDEIGFIADKRYLGALAGSGAGVIVAAPEFAALVPSAALVLVAADTYAAFVDILDVLYPESTMRAARRAAAAVVGLDPSARLEGGIVIGPGAVIGPDCEIGTGTVIGANAVIGPGVAIGRHCAIGPGASLECTLAGDRVVIHAGARIGSEGFGFLPRPAGGRKIPQLGRVILQDGVEVGANSAIDRGTLADTVVGEGTKIDNLVQIAHNCRIGRHCQIAGASAFAGSASIGDHVLCGGHTKIVGLAHVGDHSIVYAEAGVTKSFPPHSRLAGFPARDVKQWRRDMAAVARLGRTTRDN